MNNKTLERKTPKFYDYENIKHNNRNREYLYYKECYKKIKRIINSDHVMWINISRQLPDKQFLLYEKKNCLRINCLIRNEFISIGLNKENIIHIKVKFYSFKINYLNLVQNNQI